VTKASGRCDAASRDFDADREAAASVAAGRPAMAMQALIGARTIGQDRDQVVVASRPWRRGDARARDGESILCAGREERARDVSDFFFEHVVEVCSVGCPPPPVSQKYVLL